MIPLLVGWAGLSLRMAASVSLIFMLFSTTSGVAAHLKAGNVHLPTGIWMGIGGVVGGLSGARIGVLVSDRVLAAVYCGFAGVAALLLMLPSTEEKGEAGKELFPGCRTRPVPALLAGFLQGNLTGMLGLGGGSLAVPMMIYLLRMRTHQAVGTSLVVILLSAAAGLVLRASLGGLDWLAAALMVAGAVPGAWLGGKTAVRLAPKWLRRLLSLTLVAVGVRMALLYFA